MCQANVSISDDGIIVPKKDKRDFQMEIVIDTSAEEEQYLTMNHIGNVEYEEAIDEFVNNYKREKIKQPMLN